MIKRVGLILFTVFYIFRYWCFYKFCQCVWFYANLIRQHLSTFT